MLSEGNSNYFCGSTMKCCAAMVPECVRDRPHAHPPLLLTCAYFVLLVAVIAASNSDADNVNYGATASPVLLALTLLCLVASLAAFWLEVLLFYKIRRMRVEPGNPQSYVEMTHTRIQIDNSTDPVRGDALQYDMRRSRQVQEGYYTVVEALDAIDGGPHLKLKPHAFRAVLPATTAIALSLVARLCFAVDHFAAVPIRLDFGPKYGDYDGGDNVAFVPEFNSYGHAIQGLLAGLLLFPAVSGAIINYLCCCVVPRGGGASGDGGGVGDGDDDDANSERKRRRLRRREQLFVSLDVVEAFMTLYPSYSFIKRMVRASEAFATSSFLNNGTEWVWGVALGCSLGALATSVAKYRALSSLSSSSSTSSSDAPPPSDAAKTCWGDVLSYPSSGYVKQLPRTERMVLLASRISTGLLLLVTAFSSGLMVALTWNSCLDGDENCVNYSEDEVNGGIVAGFVLIPFAVVVAYKVYYYYRGDEADDLRDGINALRM